MRRILLIAATGIITPGLFLTPVLFLYHTRRLFLREIHRLSITLDLIPIITMLLSVVSTNLVSIHDSSSMVVTNKFIFGPTTTGYIHGLELVEWSTFNSAFLRQHSSLYNTIETMDLIGPFPYWPDSFAFCEHYPRRWCVFLLLLFVTWNEIGVVNVLFIAPKNIKHSNWSWTAIATRSSWEMKYGICFLNLEKVVYIHEDICS